MELYVIKWQKVIGSTQNNGTLWNDARLSCNWIFRTKIKHLHQRSLGLWGLWSWTYLNKQTTIWNETLSFFEIYLQLNKPSKFFCLCDCGQHDCLKVKNPIWALWINSQTSGIGGFRVWWSLNLGFMLSLHSLHIKESPIKHWVSSKMPPRVFNQQWVIRCECTLNVRNPVSDHVFLDGLLLFMKHGKDIQGIPWDQLQFSREKYQETWFAAVQNLSKLTPISWWA